jgi:hypothetical protein
MSTNTSPPWKKLLADPAPDGHIVQLYQDDEFFGEAISHFAAEGLVKGESIIIVATGPHWDNISGRLARKGFQVADLFRVGQLTLLDADQTLPKFLVNKMPDAKAFKSIARATIRKARAGGKYPRVRWWGEMVNVLYVNGNRKASTRLEELFDEVAHEESIAIFCSFFMDKFDAKIYDGPLGDICRTHAHLIPANDYGSHRSCVDRAVTDVFGKRGRDALLDLLVSSKHLWVPGMPPSQALLLCLKQAAPQKLDEVLTLARRYEKSTSGQLA